MTNPNEFRFKIWFEGLDDKEPALVLWYAANAEDAYRQVTSEYPECSILCCVD